jgi:formyl-CoA transferase
MLEEIRPDNGDTLMVGGIVPKLSAMPSLHRRNAPQLGQDTDDVLRELGLTQAQVEALKARGIVSGGGQ